MYIGLCCLSIRFKLLRVRRCGRKSRQMNVRLALAATAHCQTPQRRSMQPRARAVACHDEGLSRFCARSPRRTGGRTVRDHEARRTRALHPARTLQLSNRGQRCAAFLFGALSQTHQQQIALHVF